jgi:glycerol-3-phosphate dehydrogenase
MSALQTPATPFTRPAMLARLQAQGQTPWDVVVVGGGATGLGTALDAAVRGLRVLLVERHDFAKGTSSRATKLAHGGVRYLAQGNIGLVREALHERAHLLNNAPHVASALPFVMPSHSLAHKAFYGAGLVAYDALSGVLDRAATQKAGLGRTEFLSSDEALTLAPGLHPNGPLGPLRGGVKYWDGQFDDARLALALARTAAANGACVLNRMNVTALLHDGDRVAGLSLCDTESGTAYRVVARCVVNATGVWVDSVRQLDGDAGQRVVRPMVAPSQGVHLVVNRSFWPGDHALLVPKTQDGRVLFAVPWLGHVILGTTDTPRPDLAEEPQPFEEEIEFILSEAARYLLRPPGRADVLSQWVGLRPLVKPPADEGGRTQALSREHTVVVSRSGLVTVTGGKWTTYRAMAEDVVHQCAAHGLVPSAATALRSVTSDLPLLGAAPRPEPVSAPAGLAAYGSEAAAVASTPGCERELAPAFEGSFTEAMVRHAVRFEMARTVEDVLARRSRMLFLDAGAAAKVAPAVAALLQDELARESLAHYDAAADLTRFASLAAQYGLG